MNPRTGRIELRDLYLMEPGTNACLQPTGLLPTFVGELIESGTLDLSYFYHQPGTQVPA